MSKPLVIILMAVGFARLASGEPFRDKVIAVGTDSITIQVGKHPGLKIRDIASDGSASIEDPGNVKQLKVGVFSTVLVDGLPGTINDVKEGMVVQFTQGTDPEVADSIDAHTVPPAIDTPTPAPDKYGHVKNVTTSLFRKISGDVVVSISPTRITVGEPGGNEARAYYMKPFTTVTLDGAKASVNDIQPGLSVEVHGDSTTAESVDLKSAK